MYNSHKGKEGLFLQSTALMKVCYYEMFSTGLKCDMASQDRVKDLLNVAVPELHNISSLNPKLDLFRVLEKGT